MAKYYFHALSLVVAVISASSSCLAFSASVIALSVTPRSCCLLLLHNSASSRQDDDDATWKDELLLPFDQYKATASALNDVLKEASSVMSRIDSLSNLLLSIESMDPDIAAAPVGSISSPDMITGCKPLDDALQQALLTSEETGRTSLETELAWLKVDQVLQQNTVKGLVSKALLSHPSYRYGYAAALQRQQQQRTAALHTTKMLRSQSQQVWQTVRDMQERVTVEQQRLQDREIWRSSFLKSLESSSSSQ